MKVTRIRNSSVFADLEDRGTIASLNGPDIAMRGLRQAVDGAESVNTGIFECTAGSYRRIVMPRSVLAPCTTAETYDDCDSNAWCANLCGCMITADDNR